MPAEPYKPGSFVAKHQPPKLFHPSLAGSFDKSVLQISDWLSLEQNMIKSESVVVGEIESIRTAIEKQKVNINFPFSFFPFHVSFYILEGPS